MATVHTNKHNRTPLAHRRTLPVSTSAYVSAVDYTGELDLWKSVGPEVMHRWHPGPECTRFEHLSSLLEEKVGFIENTAMRHRWGG